jgi:heat shock protein HtpX
MVCEFNGGQKILRLAIMMTLLTAIFVFIGYVIGLLVGYTEFVTLGALAIAALLNVISYFFADKIVLRMSHAKIVSASDQPALHRIVSSLAAADNIPTPKVAVIESKVPNAFATGRGPSNSVVAVTTGLMGVVNDDELEGVLSHELSHVKHRDVLIASVVATIAGAISYLALIGRFGGLYAGSSSRNNNAGIFAIIVSFLAPFAALLVQTAISRSREYEADRGGAMLCRKPLALASALEKIERTVRNGPTLNANPSTSSLWIVNPFRGDTIIELFSTHPSTWKRIERLKAMAATGMI